MRLHLGGHLSYYDFLQRTDFEIELAHRAFLRDILSRLNIPEAEVFIIVINGEAVAAEDAWIQPADDVKLFPAIGGG